MIRAIAIVSLLAVLVLVLYFPALHGPADIVQVLRLEHRRAVELWGAERADQQLQSAMQWQTQAARASPLPDVTSTPAPQPAQDAVGGAVATEMNAVTRRLFANEYVRSVDALLLLASYRLAGLLAWGPWLLPVALAAAGDGALRRLVKAKEFLGHDPELFAVWCCLLILVACGTVVALVVPYALHPLALALVPIALSLLVGLSIASFHRRA